MRLSGPKAPPVRAEQVLEILRVTVAVLILIHGVYRLAAGLVAPFGIWLDSLGFPYGYGWAMAVTLYEIVGPILILARRWTSLAALGHAAILTLGMILVHFPAGWFVVGGGRNGMEYSVILIISLLAIAWAYWPVRRSA
ncbi:MULTISPECIES: DoxX family protein [unclassified Sphingopyxis]|jgi:putative oxidoreductase|uniref:DoxX family protein n=1 Tax=unclassified Sphingopyxis TaxID=2614943 RepID=UPI00078090DF|nr:MULTISPECIES: DoxX family protein [unclassified Sphingopyxis]USI76698.1 DoxX family protein [Sphingopyxis sp. USTB-05]